MENSQDLVRQEYKRYKRKKPPPDFSNVIDFNNYVKFQDKIEKITIKDETLDTCKVGLKPSSQWEAFKVISCDGFVFIKNPFVQGAQKYWTYKALTEYTRKPYPCNLDVHMNLDLDKTVWDISKLKSPSDPYNFMEKLRWTHLGYHFDYNYVNYKEEKYYGFPEELSQLMKCISKGLGFEKYKPETAIINYYPIGSSMGGHTDHYEEDLDAPLVSVSFGQPAVFLIGGKTKNIKPEAIWIRSGDIVIMSGDSRVAYHAVPCIIKDGVEGEAPDELRFASSSANINNHEESRYDSVHQLAALNETNERSNLALKNDDCKFICQLKHTNHYWENFETSQAEWKLFEDYLSKTRVNINVRQVHKDIDAS